MPDLPLPDTDRYLNASNDLKISREEIFGPVLPVIPFEGEEEAVRIANDTFMV